MGRRRFGTLGAVAVVVALTASACHPWTADHGGPGAPPTSDADGFVSTTWMRARQDDYLRFATAHLSPGSATNVINHAELARRDPSFHFDAAAVTPATLGDSFTRIDDFVDTSDFDLLYLMNLELGYGSQLTPQVRDAIAQRMVAFKYWYTDPQPAGIVDQRYYWTENHAMLYHVEEYLAGQTFPQTTFGNDGKTGAEHRARAAGLIDTVVDREGALRLHRVALGRLLPEDGGRAADVRRVRERPRACRASITAFSTCCCSTSRYTSRRGTTARPAAGRT